MTKQRNAKPDDREDNFVIDVLDDLIDTQITLENGTKVRLLMDERHVARVILGYRAALERLHARQRGKGPEKGAK